VCAPSDSVACRRSQKSYTYRITVHLLNLVTFEQLHSTILRILYPHVTKFRKAA
jgi:hypothetical protein